MTGADPVETARAFVQTAHPDAAAAVLGGSVADGTATSTSDLDIALLYDDPEVNYAETVDFEGWIVETFVHSRGALERWFDKDDTARRPVMAAIWRDGLELADDGTLAAVRADAGRRLAAGPAPLRPEERDARRYELSALIDDLREPRTGAERFTLTGDLFALTADVLLLHHRRWLGRGKWRVRRLAEAVDLPLAVALLEWAATRPTDHEDLLHLANQVLDLAGGYLQGGHLRSPAHGVRPRIGR